MQSGDDHRDDYIFYARATAAAAAAESYTEGSIRRVHVKESRNETKSNRCPFPFENSSMLLYRGGRKD